MGVYSSMQRTLTALTNQADKPYKGAHDWGETIPTIPAVQQCGRCGNYKQVGPGYRVNLPSEINLRLTDTLNSSTAQPEYTYCTAEPVYTQFQHDKAVRGTYQNAWLEGQQSGIHLQPEFTQQFFSKIRRNPDTLVWEIPEESYHVLRDKLTSVSDLVEQSHADSTDVHQSAQYPKEPKDNKEDI